SSLTNSSTRSRTGGGAPASARRTDCRPIRAAWARGGKRNTALDVEGGDRSWFVFDVTSSGMFQVYPECGCRAHLRRKIPKDMVEGSPPPGSLHLRCLGAYR